MYEILVSITGYNGPMEHPQLDNYHSLFLNDVKLLDVRAPVEFDQGAFPLSTNHPLMSDEDRHVIGLRYKDAGQDAAIKLGHERVSGAVKEDRIEKWQQFIEQNPQGVLYCFRGGLRSRITQEWIKEYTGVVYPRIKGGYKAMRRFLIDEFESSVSTQKFILLSGRTGAGKTLLLDKLARTIDLEKIYCHRGSAFGNYVIPQPSQIDIENNLSIALLKQRHISHQTLILEDEGANIGSRRLPESLIIKMKNSPLVFLESSLEERVENIFQEYIKVSLKQYQSSLGVERGFAAWSQNLYDAFVKIKRRLGGQRYGEMINLLDKAIEQQTRDLDSSAHKAWIEALLSQYYDPMYDYQLAKKSDRLIFKGSKSDIEKYLIESTETLI